MRRPTLRGSGSPPPVILTSSSRAMTCLAGLAVMPCIPIQRLFPFVARMLPKVWPSRNLSYAMYRYDPYHFASAANLQWRPHFSTKMTCRHIGVCRPGDAAFQPLWSSSRASCAISVCIAPSVEQLSRVLSLECWQSLVHEHIAST
uniref:Uncharacterized protein n=1 Tax=Aegilops tauschii subsp. strangulata TaxID=200361 RepID=A0A453QIU8_AEGTS